MTLTWTDVEDIALILHEAEPELDPLTLRFTALRERVLAIPGFTGEPERSNEKILEAIQMAWLEEFQDSQA
ncbi:MAG: Fe-S cluster assembly protein IscX [Deltaproteobacteria bacterium]|nr:Fe-S cluster assembly protein IscX [Deltaproteobacteria bacterium]